MLETIEKLLILQDRDRRIRRLQAELTHIEPERQMHRAKADQAQTALENARNKVKHAEAERKALELEVEAKKEQIARYSLQQFQTRKNEEYRALTHEIDTCKAEITRIEDKEIELMELIEVAQKEVARATEASGRQRKFVEDQQLQLTAREQNLRTELAELTSNREDLAAAVDEGTRARYDRLVKHKGENVVVGVEHGVCGGCHMRLPAQVMVTCQAQQELVTCTNCGRILYYTRDMDVAVVE